MLKKPFFSQKINMLNGSKGKKIISSRIHVTCHVLALSLSRV